MIIIKMVLTFKLKQTMKNYIKSIAWTAIAALAFAGCAKEVKNNTSEEFTHTAQVVLSKNELHPQTASKTAVVEGQSQASYVWTEGDDTRLHVYENGNKGTITNISYSQDMTSATLTVSFTGSPEAPYTYTAKYAASLSNSGNPLIPDVQTPSASNFDPAADVLISKEITSASERLSELNFTMGRVVTVNKMTLTGLGAGEKVSKVEFELAQYLSSYYTGRDSETGEAKYSGYAKKLTLNYNELTVPSNGEFPVYFISAPVSASGIVGIVVTTDKKVYIKTSSLNPNPFDGKSITFAIGSFTRFSMGLSGYDEPIGTAVNYTLVDSDDYIADGGEYLIVNAEGTKAMGAYTSASSSYFGLTDVAAENNVISIAAEQVRVITLEESAAAGQFYMKDDEGNYLYWSSGNNINRGEKGNTDGYLWTVEADKITCVKLDGTDERLLQFNSNNTRFSCYKNTQANVKLYVNLSTVSVTPKLSAPTNVEAIVDEDDILVTWTDITAPSGQNVTYSVTCTGETTQVIPQGVGACTFENLSDGTYEISVTALPSSGDYRQSSAKSVSNLVVNTATPAAANYVKVTSNLSDWSGQYLIVYETNDVAFDGSLSNLDSTPNTFEVTINNNKIESTSAVDAKSFTIASMEGGYSIQASTGKYIGRSANSNGLDSSDSELVNTITWSDHPVITGAGSKTLGFNSASNQLKFRYLGNSSIELYKLEDTRQDPGMSWSAPSATATIATGNVISFTAPTLTAGNASGITYQSTNPEVATINAAGVVTVLAGGETTIKAIFAGDATYSASTVQYTLTVTDNREDVATPTFSPAAGEVAANATVTISCTTASATIYYTVDGSTPSAQSTLYSGAITIDAAKTIKAIAVKEGYKNSAVATAEYTISGAVESLPFSESFASNKGSFTIDDINNGGLSAVWTHATHNSDAYMKATGYSSTNHATESWLVSPTLQIPALSSGESVILKFYQCVNTYFGTIEDEATVWVKENGGDWVKQTISYPSVASGFSAFELQNVDLSSYANKKIKIAFKYTSTSNKAGTWEINNVSVQKYASYAVTFSQPANGTITVKHGDNTLTSGASIAQGETITITATPANGYSLASIKYNDGSDHDITDTKSFTMPAHAVSITATFEQSTGEPTVSTYTFTSKSWGDSSNSWTSGKDGNQLTSGRGVQVTTGVTGANATTKSSFTGVSSVVVTYSTNGSAGAGSISIKVGSNTAHTQTVTKTGGTTDRTLTYTISPAETGAVTITVTCSTNSIYVKSVAITHN